MKYLGWIILTVVFFIGWDFIFTPNYLKNRRGQIPPTQAPVGPTLAELMDPE